MMKKHFLLLSVLVCFLLISCSENSEREGQDQTESTETLQHVEMVLVEPGSPLASLQFSDSTQAITYAEVCQEVFTSYKYVINGQLTVDSNLTRLLQEVEYTGYANTVELEEMRKRIPELKNFQYPMDQIPDFDAVGVNDDANDLIVGTIVAYSKGVKNSDHHPLIASLCLEIDSLNGNYVLQTRNWFNQAVDAYHLFIADHRDQLLKDGNKEDQLVTIRSFALPPEQ